MMQMSVIANTAASAPVTGEALISGPFEVLWGFVFVVGTLLLFAVVTYLIGVFLKSKAAPAAATAPAAIPKSEMEAMPPALVAVIAAAIHETLHEPARIVSIRSLRGQSGWAAEGRRSIFSSHRVR